MASEIRANKQTNRAGLGTVTYTDTGIIVSGIVTANSFKGDGSSLTGITTVGGARGVDFDDGVKIRLGDSQDLQIYHDSNHSYIDDAGTGNLRLRSGTLEITNLASNKTSAVFSSGGGQTLNFNNSAKFVTTNSGAIVTGVLTAISFSGDGSSLSNLPAGAPVGGASTNTVFF